MEAVLPDNDTTSKPKLNPISTPPPAIQQSYNILKSLFTVKLNRSLFLPRYLLSIFGFIFLILALNLISENNGTLRNFYMIGFLFIILITFIYQISIYVRRLWDAGRSPLWALLAIVVFPANFLLLLFLLFVPSKKIESTFKVSSENNSTRDNKKVLFMVDIFLIILIIFGIYLFLNSYSNSQPPTNTSTKTTLLPTPTPKLLSSNIFFRDSFGKLEIFFNDYYNQAYGSTEQDGNWYLNENNRKLYFTFYTLKEDLLPKLNIYKNSDGNNAGEGCFLSDDKTTIANIEFQKEYCYYNPINLTESGKYDKNISSVRSTNCVAFLERENKAISGLRIYGEGPGGIDYCQDFSNLMDLKIELFDPIVISKESLVGTWHECNSMPNGWCAHYNFYSSGKYSYYYNLFDCTERNIKESGFWSFQNNILKLETKTATILEGGTLVGFKESGVGGACSSDKILIDAIEKNKMFETPLLKELNVKNLQYPTIPASYDNYVNSRIFYEGISLNNKPFWKFRDDPTGFRSNGKQEFPEPTGF